MTAIITRTFAAILLAACATIYQSCAHHEQLISIGVDDAYIIARMQLLVLETPYHAQKYEWCATSPSGNSTILSASERCLFVTAEEGIWRLTLTVDDDGETIRQTAVVNVVHEEIEYSPDIARVFDYSPAPGQFINKMPRWQQGDTKADMTRKVETALSGGNEELVSLGAYGGCIVFGFDHTVVNIDGQKDIMIKGNSFYDDPASGVEAGSAEPGIVMVAIDANGNGVPDDAWYELAGSEYHSPATRHNYTIRYTAPDDNKTPVSDGAYISDMEYIPWQDSEGASGYVMKNTEHAQSYWPQWIDATELTFTGSLLANNAVDESGTDLYYRLYAYPWGYADNQPNSRKDLCSFDIGWAVDSLGNPVRLPGIDFVKVYTALNQYCNWLGETSTEISGATDLHIN